MRNFLLFIWEVIKVVIIALIIVVPIRYFLFQPFFVKGQSMEPNFENGDYLIIDEISYRFRHPQRGEVVVFKYPENLSQRYIKRIVGLPEETIEIKNGKVVIFGKDYNPPTTSPQPSAGPLSQILDESDYLSPATSTAGDIRVSLAENEFYVLGDNRIYSADSRRWGPLDKEYIIGRVFFRAWPISALAKIEIPTY